MAEEIIQGILPVEIPNVDEIDIKYEDTEFLNNGTSSIEDYPGLYPSTQMTSSNINSIDHHMDTAEESNVCEIKCDVDESVYKMLCSAENDPNVESETEIRIHAVPIRKNRKVAINTWTVQSNFICTFKKCYESFDAYHKLMFHEKTHKKFCRTCAMSFDNNRDLFQHRKTHPIKQPSRKSKSRKTGDESKAPQNNRLPSSTKTSTESSAPEENLHHNANIGKVICTGQNQDGATISGEANQTSKTGSELLVHSMTHTASTLPKTERPKIRQNKISTGPPDTHSGKSELIAEGGDESIHQGDKEFSCEVCDLTFDSSNELILQKKSHTGRKHTKKDKSGETVDFSFSESDSTTQTRDNLFSSKTCKETSYTEDSLSHHANAQDARNNSRTFDDPYETTETGETSQTAITESELTVNELAHSNRTLPKMEKRIVIRLHRISSMEIQILTKNSTADTRLTRYTRKPSVEDEHDKSKLIPQDRDDTGNNDSSKTRAEPSGRKYKFRKENDTRTGESYANIKKNSTTRHRRIGREKAYASPTNGRKLRRKSVSQTHLKILKGGRKGLRNHSVGKLHKCDVCGQVYTTKNALTVHTRKHTGEKPFKCDVCPKGFPTKFNLKLHSALHTGVRPYKCDSCEKTFKSSFDLTIHKRIHTGEKPFRCDVCDKCFSYNGGLTRHERIHTGERPYMCDVCRKSFVRCSDLIRHKRIHTGEKQYTCDVCGKSFLRSNELTTHKRRHTGEKPFRCGECDKRFTSSQSLTMHKRTHTGEKPFECDVCHESFTSKNILYFHKTVHTGGRLRPFKCDVCNTGCTTKTKLNDHMRTHTGEKPFKCNECDKCFSMNGSLNVHRRRKHHT